MSAENAIKQRVIEALQSRGFSKSESEQMIRRIKEGKEDIETDQIDPSAAQKIYMRGFSDGAAHERKKIESNKKQPYFQNFNLYDAYRYQQEYNNRLYRQQQEYNNNSLNEYLKQYQDAYRDRGTFNGIG